MYNLKVKQVVNKSMIKISELLYLVLESRNKIFYNINKNLIVYISLAKNKIIHYISENYCNLTYFKLIFF